MIFFKGTFLKITYLPSLQIFDLRPTMFNAFRFNVLIPKLPISVIHKILSLHLMRENSVELN